MIFQDNKSAIQIANNRRSLGKNSRAMELQRQYLATNNMIADMGSKALPENPFARFRDSMNGYALVSAKYRSC